MNETNETTSELFSSPTNMPPDPSKPTLTSDEAQMVESQPHPAHVTQRNVSGITFDQAVRGFEQTYRRWTAVKACYTAIREMLAGHREAPIISFPTGKVDEAGNQTIFELDINATLPREMPKAERIELLKRQLGPWNNYLCVEYKKWTTQLERYIVTVNRLLGPADQPASSATPDQIPPIPTAETT